jgi:hypothetical protein
MLTGIAITIGVLLIAFAISFVSYLRKQNRYEHRAKDLLSEIETSLGPSRSVPSRENRAKINLALEELKTLTKALNYTRLIGMVAQLDYILNMKESEISKATSTLKTVYSKN